MSNSAIFDTFTQSISNHRKISYEAGLLIVSYFQKYLSKQNNHPYCYINVMNNHTLELTAHQKKLANSNYDFEKERNIYVRKEHGYAHITVTFFDKKTESGFRNFDDRKYYYIVRASKTGQFSIREELIDNWAKSGNAPELLIIDVEGYRAMVKSPKDLTPFLSNKRLNESSDFIFDFDTKNCGWNNWTLVQNKAAEESAHAFVAQFNKFLGNVKYNKYEARTAIKVISYKNGNKSKEVYFKSIKQAYDMLQAAGFNLTYKTFQRKCNAEKPSLIETDKMSFYVTKHLDFVGPDTLTV